MFGYFGKALLQHLANTQLSYEATALKIATRGLALRNCQTFPAKGFGKAVSVSFTRPIKTASLLHKNKITINIVDRNRKTHTVQANIDDTILNVVLDNDLDFESYGVCEGTVACSTCHVIFDKEVFDTLEEPLMDEMDMLDLACGLTETSRLGCQVHLTKEMDGMTVRLPEEITDARDL